MLELRSDAGELNIVPEPARACLDRERDRALSGVLPGYVLAVKSATNLAGPFPGIEPETDLEAQIVSDPEWAVGAAWGEPRPGHPEGQVAAHIADVLRNVELEAAGPNDRARLRQVALIHDTFKHRVDRALPRAGENQHAVIARRFAERHIDDREILEVIELHDEAYNAWVKGQHGGKWEAAQARVDRLIDRLGSSAGFYTRFYRADNATGTKDEAPLQWFEKALEHRNAT